LGLANLLMGLLFPIVILAGDAALERISFAHFIPNGGSIPKTEVQDFVVLR